VGCGAVRPKPQLRRFALSGDLVVLDPQGAAPGRGAYVCDAACARQALRRRAFARAFRRPVTTAPDLVESLS
jgi:uncharacterized protein